MSTKSIFLQFRFDGGGVQAGTSPPPSPFGVPMVISTAYEGVGRLEDRQTETTWK